MDTVRAVLFDLDDTLTASNEFAADVLSASAAEHGVVITAENVRAYRGARGAHVNRGFTADPARLGCRRRREAR